MDNKEKTLQERILLGMACEINCTHDTLHKYAFPSPYGVTVIKSLSSVITITMQFI